MIGEKSAWYPLFALCVAPQVFEGNFETIVILVRVARPYITDTGVVYIYKPYITETRESFASTRRSSVQPSRAIRPQ